MSKVLDIWARTNGHCFYCGVKLHNYDTKNPHRLDGFTVDHLIPRSKGGNSDLSNLVPACKSCNSSKSNKTLEQYRLMLVERSEYHKVTAKLSKVMNSGLLTWEEYEILYPICERLASEVKNVVFHGERRGKS